MRGHMSHGSTRSLSPLLLHVLFWLVALSPTALPQSQPRKDPHADAKASDLYIWCEQYQGNLETKGDNRGPIIDKWNRAVGAALGSPHCAAGVSAGLRETKAEYPKTQTAWARAFAKNEGIDARDVFYGRVKLDDKPYVASYVRNGGGHVGFNFWQEAGKLFGWESNTSPPAGIGSQWNGSYTGFKERSVKSACSPWNAFRIVKFVPVRPALRREAGVYGRSRVTKWLDDLGRSLREMIT